MQHPTVSFSTGKPLPSGKLGIPAFPSCGFNITNVELPNWLCLSTSKGQQWKEPGRPFSESSKPSWTYCRSLPLCACHSDTQPLKFKWLFNYTSVAVCMSSSAMGQRRRNLPDIVTQKLTSISQKWFHLVSVLKIEDHRRNWEIFSIRKMLLFNFLCLSLSFSFFFLLNICIKGRNILKILSGICRDCEPWRQKCLVTFTSVLWNVLPTDLGRVT